MTRMDITILIVILTQNHFKEDIYEYQKNSNEGKRKEL